MNADATFVIGKSHRICQDYARADINGEYTILSDGCSASQDSDWGARLLVKSVENDILNRGSGSILGSLYSAKSIANALQLCSYALDATLFLARFNNFTNTIDVSTYGDGVIAAVRKDGIVVAYHIEYPSGYPQYLSYRLDYSRQQDLEEVTGGNDPAITTWIEDVGGFSQKPLDMVLKKRLDELYISFPVEEYSVVATFSDGVNSFIDENRVAIPWTKIVQEMMNFGLARKGEFVHRQMNWINKQIINRKWNHADDLSMTAINLE